MASITIINLSDETKIWGGQTFVPDYEYTIQNADRKLLIQDDFFIQDLNNGLALVTKNNKHLDATYGFMAVTMDEQSYSMIAAGIDGTNSIANFLDANSEVYDTASGVKGPFYLMQTLDHRRDLYNDTENPLYVPGHVPILGPNGILEEDASRILNLETIHGKTGWHEQQVIQAQYSRPKDLLVYYGYLNSFNYGVNGWNNEKVAVDMARYQLLVFGDGVQNPSHPDYANTLVIIPRIKALNPEALIFGYVPTPDSTTDFNSKVDQWNTLGVHGIFMDEAGYDYGVTRDAFNTHVDYVHSLAKRCFANAWNTDHILGTANDPSFPNSTYNPGLVESNLNILDWVLLESFPINTSAFVGNYEDKMDWFYRGQKIRGQRFTYGINAAALCVINNDNTSGDSLFQFGYTSASMWSLEAFGSSDTNYASSSAMVNYWSRPYWINIRSLGALAPTVAQATDSTNVFYRYTENSHLRLDFSSGVQNSVVTVYGSTGINGGGGGTQGATGLQGSTGIQGIGTQGATGLQGSTGIQGIGTQGVTGLEGQTGIQGIGTQGVTGLEGQTGIQGIGTQGATGLQGSGAGYAINVQALTSSPADGATVYFGMQPRAPTTTAGTSRVYIRKEGTIKVAEIYCYSGTAGTNEAWSLYVRLNNTTDYLISTLSVNTNQRVFSNESLNIAVIAGDYIEIKGVQPTWATNPATTIYGGYIYIE